MIFTTGYLRKKSKKHKGPLYREAEISDILDHLGADRDKYDLAQVVKGGDHELEHGKGKWVVLKSETDIVGAVKIALAHLEEDPKYYDHLEEMEKKHGKKEEPVSERLEKILKRS